MDQPNGNRVDERKRGGEKTKEKTAGKEDEALYPWGDGYPHIL